MTIRTIIQSVRLHRVAAVIDQANQLRKRELSVEGGGADVDLVDTAGSKDGASRSEKRR